MTTTYASDFLTPLVDVSEAPQKRLCMEVFIGALQRKLAEKAEEKDAYESFGGGKVAARKLRSLQQILLRYPDADTWRHYFEREQAKNKSEMYGQLLQWLPNSKGELEGDDHPVRQSISEAWQSVDYAYQQLGLPVDESEMRLASQHAATPALREFLMLLTIRGLYDERR